jgi:hypothetical protein
VEKRAKVGQKAGKRSVKGCEGVVGPLQGAILPISADTGGYGVSTHSILSMPCQTKNKNKNEQILDKPMEYLQTTGTV